MSFVKNAVAAAAVLALTSAAFAMSPADKKEASLAKPVVAVTAPVAAKDLVPVAATQSKATKVVPVTAMPTGSAVAAPVAATKSTPTQKLAVEKKVEHKAEHKTAPAAK